jgi:hypothetical protein
VNIPEITPPSNSNHFADGTSDRPVNMNLDNGVKVSFSQRGGNAKYRRVDGLARVMVETSSPPRYI